MHDNSKSAPARVPRRCNMPVPSQGSPLTASAEPVRLTFLPGLTNASGESLVALAAGHPRRPLLLGVFPSMAAALSALRRIQEGRPA